MSTGGAGSRQHRARVTKLFQAAFSAAKPRALGDSHRENAVSIAQRRSVWHGRGISNCRHTASCVGAGEMNALAAAISCAPAVKTMVIATAPLGRAQNLAGDLKA